MIYQERQNNSISGYIIVKLQNTKKNLKKQPETFQ